MKKSFFNLTKILGTSLICIALGTLLGCSGGGSSSTPTPTPSATPSPTPEAAIVSCAEGKLCPPSNVNVVNAE